MEREAGRMADRTKKRPVYTKMIKEAISVLGNKASHNEITQHIKQNYADQVKVSTKLLYVTKDSILVPSMVFLTT